MRIKVGDPECSKYVAFIDGNGPIRFVTEGNEEEGYIIAMDFTMVDNRPHVKTKVIASGALTVQMCTYSRKLTVQLCTYKQYGKVELRRI